jgi:hypothetical protein
MTNHREALRINNLNMSLPNIITALADGNHDAMKVMFQLTKKDDGFFELLNLDAKGLYGANIWKVYKDVCGENIERFMYHLDIELPCQICGEVSITGPYAAKVTKAMDNEEFWNSRSYGKPGSFWALKEPPTDPNYDFPILNIKRTEGKRNTGVVSDVGTGLRQNEGKTKTKST